MNTDKKTTIAGVLGGVFLAIRPLVPPEFQPVYDSVSAAVAGNAIILLGYWTNK